MKPEEFRGTSAGVLVRDLVLLDFRPHIHLIPIELAVWRKNLVVGSGDLQPLSYRVLVAEHKSASFVATAAPPRDSDFIR
jgi:hypothetical protein